MKCSLDQKLLIYVLIVILLTIKNKLLIDYNKNKLYEIRRLQFNLAKKLY